MSIYIALGFSIGSGLLLYAHLFWNHSFKSQKEFISRSGHREITTVLVVAGLMLIIYTSLESAFLYKHYFKVLFDSVSDNNIKLILGALGFVMTVITVGVVTLSRNTLLDIREEKEVIKKERKTIIKEFQVLQSILNPTLSKFHLELKRQNILYQTTEELKSLYNSTQSDELDEKISLRGFLKTIYSNPEADVLEVLSYLNTYYDREKHGRLMGMEIDYIQQIIEYYKQYPSDDIEYNQEVINLGSSILKK